MKNENDVQCQKSETVQIAKRNAQARIGDAIATIMHCWDEWEAMAGQESQVAQTPDAGIAFLEDQLGAVLTGMVFDQD